MVADDGAFLQSLYAAANEGTPLPLMLQCGKQQGEMMAVFVPQLRAQLPVYNGQQPVLQWEFSNSLGEGIADDELYVAFA
jgi:hypothetical protein